MFAMVNASRGRVSAVNGDASSCQVRRSRRREKEDGGSDVLRRCEPAKWNGPGEAGFKLSWVLLSGEFASDVMVCIDFSIFPSLMR